MPTCARRGDPCRSSTPKKSGYGYVIERYVTRKGSDRPRYRELKSGRVLRPGWPRAERSARHLIDDAATISDAELEALLGFEWRSRFTAAWLIGIGRRAAFRERIGDLLLASEVCFSGGAYCFALARFGPHADAEVSRRCRTPHSACTPLTEAIMSKSPS